MGRVGVLTDSVACLPDELRDRLRIGMVGVHLILDGEAYRDSIDLSAAELHARIGEVADHRTAAPSVGDWATEMQRVVDNGADALLVVCLASTMSSTYDSARVAAGMLDVPTAVIDSQTVAAAEGLLVRRLAEEALAGATLEELVERAERRRGSYRLEFVLAGLEHVARTGRLPRALARLVDAVDAKPVVTLSGTGEIRATGVVRGLDGGVDRLERRVLERFAPGTPGRAVVSHAELPDEADDLVRRLRSARPGLEVDLALFSPVMVLSSGPVVGIAWEDPAVAAGASGPGRR